MDGQLDSSRIFTHLNPMAKLTHGFVVLTICAISSLMATGCFSCSTSSRTPPTQIIIQAPPGSTATIVQAPPGTTATIVPAPAQ